MANIILETSAPIEDGTTLSFRAPCACTAVTAITVVYPAVSDNQLVQVSKDFYFVDTHINSISALGDLFVEGALVQVMLDTTNGYAFFLNADTNGYLEHKLSMASTMNKMLSAGYLILTENLQYAATLPAAGNKGRVFFKKV